MTTNNIQVENNSVILTDETFRAFEQGVKYRYNNHYFTVVKKIDRKPQAPLYAVLFDEDKNEKTLTIAKLKELCGCTFKKVYNRDGQERSGKASAKPVTRDTMPTFIARLDNLCQGILKDFDKLNKDYAKPCGLENCLHELTAQLTGWSNKLQQRYADHLERRVSAGEATARIEELRAIIAEMDDRLLEAAKKGDFGSCAEVAAEQKAMQKKLARLEQGLPEDESK